MMFKGSFEQAKFESAAQGKWLIANVQSTKEFGSYMLNRDTWANQTVKETMSASFIFWQIYNDNEEGRKVWNYYHLTEMPSTLVIDSITGQKMKLWEGMISPQRLLEDLIPYIDNSPMEFGHPTKRLAKEDTQEKEVVKREYPTLPEEPQGDKGVNICRVAVRLPNGKRVQRRFLQTDPIQLLWSFCCSQLKEASDGRHFRLAPALPAASLGVGTLDYDTNLIFGDSGLSNSLIFMTWE